jgi:hypothetical protein
MTIRDFNRDPLTPGEEEALGRLAASAHAAGNASVAANPSDPAFWMLFDGHQSMPVVHRDGCYICEDDEFAQMGLSLCRACPECVRAGRGLGHVPADDETCDDCDAQDGPWNYDEEGMITGLSPERAIAIWNVTHPKSPR